MANWNLPEYCWFIVLTEDIIIGNFANFYLSEPFYYMLSPQQ